MKKGLSPRVILVVIASLFVLPLALAWLMYTGTIEYRPVSTRNLGVLVQPPVPLSWDGARLSGAPDQLPSDAFGRHWLVLHAVPTPCGDACLRAVTDLRQVHRAAGREQSRIRLALLQDSDAEASRRLTGIYPQFYLLEDPSGTVWAQLEALTAAVDSTVPTGGSTYLIDPLGNIMMHYAAGYDPNDLKKDLKRLLTWSKLDEQ